MPERKRKRTPDTDDDMMGLHDHSEMAGYAIARQLIYEEVDLEISIRQRLQETIESRIAWASRLQNCLSSATDTRDLGNNHDSANVNPFHLAAADALHVIETPLLPILSREARFSSRNALDVASTPSAVTTANPYARPHTRHTRLRRSPPVARPTPIHIFVRDPATNAVARLACPDCSRTDFTRVQSLLNHCRIQHGREFSNHDECIRACAARVSTDDEAWVTENGTELRNISLPSVRRLFEIAVGSVTSPLDIAASDHLPANYQSSSQGNTPSTERESSQPSPTPTTAHTSTHLSRTLGHHADTPALAQFLGRAPKRRGITIHDENTPVDIDGGLYAATRRRWHMPFTHRSRARPALDIAVPAETLSQPPTTPNSTPAPSADTQGSRFHIVARVAVSDRSLWIPIERRPASAPEHTHQWLLSIEAPTYSLPIGAILERATFTCASEGTSPTAALADPLVVSGPTFFASGTTAQPFLARIRFEWAGGSLNPPLEVEHWVELDAIHAGTPVLGDEQVLDVELDRNTVLLPATSATEAVDPWSLGADALPIRTKLEPAPTEDRPPAYVVLLEMLVPGFPLTLRDVKGKVPANLPNLPYKLVHSPVQFRTLVLGRRKAIEWARARALREAYEGARRESAPETEYPSLSVGDVFAWLADAGFSLRAAVPPSAPTIARTTAPTPSAKRIMKKMTPSVASGFCPSCGLDLSRHPSSQNSQEAPSGSASCPFSANYSSPLLPLLDVGLSFPGDSAHTHSQHQSVGLTHRVLSQHRAFDWSAGEVLAAVDPMLTFAVREITAPLKLSRFEAPLGGFAAGVCALRQGGNTVVPLEEEAITAPDQSDSTHPTFRAAAMDSLAASAVMALAVREFARHLLQSGATALEGDCARTKGNLSCVLAPAHVVRGVCSLFLARDAALPDLSPAALALSTLAQVPPRRDSPHSAVMDTPSRFVDPPAGSLSSGAQGDGG
ncbi:hypothetical protein BC834DRAFT_885036 [Gloeopeniophorella convolvens]|nr:hypothetical protein BC834DRAFT_885036 [Gloeopeniophorella convolvens]